MYLIFDTETTGLPKRWNAPVTDTDNWPRCIQIAWQLHDAMGNLLEHQDYLVVPDGFDVPFEAEQIHGISTALAQDQGLPLLEVLERFTKALEKCHFVVGQNVGFDLNIMGAEFHRAGVENLLTQKPVLDTCTEQTASMCEIPGGRGGKFKLPTLTELHQYLFGEPFGEAHNATADVEATSRCFLELLRLKHYPLDKLGAPADYYNQYVAANPEPMVGVGLKHVNLKEASAALQAHAQPEISAPTKQDLKENLAQLEDAAFVHLHNHSQFSVLAVYHECKGFGGSGS